MSGDGLREAETAGSMRFLDPPELETAAVRANPGASPGRSLDAAISPGASPLALVLPQEFWKHAAAALVWLGLGWGVLAAGRLAPPPPIAGGLPLVQLLGGQGGSLLAWLSSLTLLFAAQAACLIWHVRSRCPNDFAGRYHIWAKTAAVWFALSTCTATGLHLVASELVAAALPAFQEPLRRFGWRAAAILVAAWLLPALRREMRTARPGFAALIAAAAAGLYALVVQLGGTLPGGSFTVEIVATGASWSACVLLLLSMTLHARHVVYCSSEAPVEQKRPKLPRPHFRWPWPRSARSAGPACVQEAPADGQAVKPRVKKIKSRKPGVTQAALEETPATVAAPVKPAPSAKPRLRLDARHSPPMAPPANGPVSAFEPALSQASPTPTTTKVASSPMDERQSVLNAERAELRDQTDARDDVFDSAAARADLDFDDSAQPPELHGLSKKQRRRLMQQQREQARDARR